MNQVAKTDPADGEIINEADLAAVNNLAAVIGNTRAKLRDANQFSRAVITSKAMIALKRAITPAMLKDFKELMNDPLGFKTDRPPGTKAKNGSPLYYDDNVVKTCIIQALLLGAEIAGNEFNIIAGQAYLTKEFYQRVIEKHPHVAQFEYELGPAKRHGDRSAIMEAVATWFNPTNGEAHKLECVDKSLQDPPGLDMRIVVNAYATSSPDELRGKGISKLFRRVAERLTGEELPDTDEATNIVDASSRPVEPARLQSATDDAEPSDAAAANVDDAIQAYLDGVCEEFGRCQKISDVTKVAKDQTAAVAKTDWPAKGQDFCRSKIAEFRDARVAVIRAK